MNNFEPSSIWGVVQGGESFNSYCQKVIPDFEFNENVPESIKRRFVIIRKLLEFSYYEYEFIDVVLEISK